MHRFQNKEMKVLFILLCIFIVAYSTLLDTSKEYNIAAENNVMLSSSSPHRGLKDAGCPNLSKELLNKYARNNTVMITVADNLMVHYFGLTWIQNVKASEITYWFIAALDPQTSQFLKENGVEQCFNAPQDVLHYKGSDKSYAWGSHHWSQTTWMKAMVANAVHDLGFHVVHSDMDVTWFSDPLEFFHKQTTKQAMLISLDALNTANGIGDANVEADATPYAGLNTGVYFLPQNDVGHSLMKEWLRWYPRHVGHDQDGMNIVVRGEARTGDKSLPQARKDPREPRMIYISQNYSVPVSYLPPSMFGNTYTKMVANLAEVTKVPLYEVHWVWGGDTREAKRANIRDLGRFHDPPEYYNVKNLLTIGIEYAGMPADYNSRMALFDTESMVQFHVKALEKQLQQLYYGFALALALDRVFVLPKILCYCAKNWYMTEACRLHGEKYTQFPFVCPLTNYLRAKRVTTTGLVVQGRAVHVREYSFLNNPRVPDEVKRSRTIIWPSQAGPAPTSAFTPLIEVRGNLTGNAINRELVSIANTPLLHVAHPGLVFGGFSDFDLWAEFNKEISKLAAYWCCRSPHDQKVFNLSEKVYLKIVPPHMDVKS